ncbi:helix-turn-helix domain-containing protein [Anaerotruncus massiliensis (ex Liu et al. 2021)]|uniref:Stage 0 sporulation protein A homolog n=2 Tax=Anaerotruncus TaxID=244127 RepID=A0A498CP13_9FIRM|nr:helix-turn-helix domain-containing protein [Anaerotruncus massiliensis (ex Liu et al. 2021)]
MKMNRNRHFQKGTGVNMYKIMLAEDELEVLGAMLRTIRWTEHGFDPPVGCRDGREAIEKLEGGFVPDVLITDICMPFVDGLELTRYINEHLPNTVVVILTGYDDFQYAHRAIKMQVYDYVLKPVTPASINELTDRLRGELDERRLRNIDDSMQIVASYFLNQLMTRRLDAKRIEESCRAHKLDFAGRYHIAAVLDVDLRAPATEDDGGNLELMRYGLANIAQELSENSHGTLAFQGNDGLTKLIISSGERDGLYAAAIGLCRTISKTAGAALQVPVSGGIGDPVAYLDELHLSHGQAMTALGYRFFYGESSVTCVADVDIRETRDIDYFSCERRLEAAVKTLDREGARAAVHDLVGQLRSGHVPFERCVLYSQKLMMTLIGLTDELIGGAEVESLEKTWEQFNFYSAPTLGRLERMIDEVCDKAFKILALTKSDTAAAQVSKAEKYIREHYGDPRLSLNMITEHLAISTSYFSAIFKSRTGATFVEYLTRVRMEKAQQILAFTDRRTYEAAEDVGFSDPHYFSVTFKRVTGMTPKEYREFSRRGDTAPQA